MNPFNERERVKYYKELKLKKARERKLKSYHKNKANNNSKRKQKRCETVKVSELTEVSIVHKGGKI